MSAPASNRDSAKTLAQLYEQLDAIAEVKNAIHNLDQPGKKNEALTLIASKVLLHGPQTSDSKDFSFVAKSQKNCVVRFFEWLFRISNKTTTHYSETIDLIKRLFKELKKSAPTIEDQKKIDHLREIINSIIVHVEGATNAKKIDAIAWYNLGVPPPPPGPSLLQPQPADVLNTISRFLPISGRAALRQTSKTMKKNVHTLLSGDAGRIAMLIKQHKGDLKQLYLRFPELALEFARVRDTIKTFKLETCDLTKENLKILLEVFPNIETLELVECGLKNDSLPIIATKLKKLKSLSIKDNFNITADALPALNNCTELRHLNISGLRVGNLVRVSLPKLERLVLDNASDSFLQQLASACPELQDLSIRHHAAMMTLAGVQHLARCQKLSVLHIQNCSSVMLMEISKVCKGVQILDLDRGESPVTLIREDILQNFKQLHTLKISVNTISNQNLIDIAAGCSQLEHLELVDCRSSASFSELLEFPKLKTLNLTDTPIGEERLLQFANSCPQLQEIHLGGWPKLSNKCVAALAKRRIRIK